MRKYTGRNGCTHREQETQDEIKSLRSNCIIIKVQKQNHVYVVSALKFHVSSCSGKTHKMSHIDPNLTKSGGSTKFSFPERLCLLLLLVVLHSSSPFKGGAVFPSPFGRGCFGRCGCPILFWSGAAFRFLLLLWGGGAFSSLLLMGGAAFLVSFLAASLAVGAAAATDPSPSPSSALPRGADHTASCHAM